MLDLLTGTQPGADKTHSKGVDATSRTTPCLAESGCARGKNLGPPKQAGQSESGGRAERRITLIRTKGEFSRIGEHLGPGPIDPVTKKTSWQMRLVHGEIVNVPTDQAEFVDKDCDAKQYTQSCHMFSKWVECLEEYMSESIPEGGIVDNEQFAIAFRAFELEFARVCLQKQNVQAPRELVFEALDFMLPMQERLHFAVKHCQGQIVEEADEHNESLHNVEIGHASVADLLLGEEESHCFASARIGKEVVAPTEEAWSEA